MKILIKNCNLISVNDKRDKLENNMDILITNDKITKIGKDIKEEVDKVIDASNKVVMPGLINTHAHVPMSIFRETLSGYTLQDWLEKKIWPMEDKLTGEDVYYASYLSFLEMIKTGTTTINDMYFVTDYIIKAMEDTGVRLQTTRTLMDVEGTNVGKGRFNELKMLIDNNININININNTRLTFNTGIHGLYTCSPDYVDECLEFAHNNNLLVHMHYCENSKEVEDDKNLQHDLPINVIKNKFKDYKVLLAHCVKVSHEELDILKDMNISVSHCPVSNLKLGCGVADVNYMNEIGINVSLGTDGQGTGSNLDLFEVMKYTALLQKGKYEDPTKIDAYDVIKMATINGAKALCLDDKIGSIEEGKQADLIIINTNNIIAKPTNDLISQIVYNIKGSDVDTTIIDGNILMENRKLKTNKEQEIINKCENIFERISNQI